MSLYQTILRNNRVNKVLTYLLMVVLAFFVLFPLYWLFLTSLRSKGEVYEEPKLYVDKIYWQNYTEPFLEGEYGRKVINSLIIAFGNTFVVLALAIPASYALSRFKIYGSKHLFFWMLTNRMAPPAAFILPLFLIYTFLGIIDTHFGLIILYCVFNLPFAIWLLKGIIDGIPTELDEAARIDGASLSGVMFRIILPLSKAGVAVTAILVWLFAWNHYILASQLTMMKARTVTTGLAKFVTLVGIDWGAMSAVAIVCMLPAIVFLLFVQDYIVAGLTFGAIKE